MRTYLDFEKPIAELESRVAELKALAATQRSAAIEEELAKLEAKAREALVETYSDLTPWQKTQVARHPERPHFRHYVNTLVQDFTPLAGDRYYGEDQAIIGGIGRLSGRSVMVIGHEKGSDTEGRIKHNFGMARPEGYRKSVRLMEMAERFQLAVVSLVDTAGAYPGIGAEERGQAEAIARSTDCCMGLGVPIVSVIIGEGGSGGAVAIATANRIYMLEHAIYTVASPEAAASILWRDSRWCAPLARPSSRRWPPMTTSPRLRFARKGGKNSSPWAGRAEHGDRPKKRHFFESTCSLSRLIILAKSGEPKGGLR